MIVTIAKSFKQVISVKEGNIGLYFLWLKFFQKQKYFAFTKTIFVEFIQIQNLDIKIITNPWDKYAM